MRILKSGLIFLFSNPLPPPPLVSVGSYPELSRLNDQPLFGKRARTWQGLACCIIFLRILYCSTETSDATKCCAYVSLLGTVIEWKTKWFLKRHVDLFFFFFFFFSFSGCSPKVSLPWWVRSTIWSHLITVSWILTYWSSWVRRRRGSQSVKQKISSIESKTPIINVEWNE